MGKLDAQFAAGKAALEADVRAAHEAAEALRAEVTQLRGTTRERLAASEDRVAELQARSCTHAQNWAPDMACWGWLAALAHLVFPTPGCAAVQRGSFTASAENEVTGKIPAVPHKRHAPQACRMMSL